MRLCTADSHRRLLTGLLLVALIAMTGAATLAADEAVLDDGLTASERADITQLMAQAEFNEMGCIPAILIVDTARHNACFGMYRLSQMTQPGWNLFGGTVAWALDNQPAAEVRVFLATYNGTLDPDQHDDDGLAAYNYLINDFGIHPDSLDVGSQTALELNDFTDYDLVIYTNSYPRQLDGILGPGIPFITTSVRQTELMGIGTGDFLLHEDRSYAYVADNTHPITDGYNLGLLQLADHMWMDASYASGTGLAIVVADTTCYFPPVEIKISGAASTELGAVDTMAITLGNFHSWLDMGGFELALQYDQNVMADIIDILPGSIPEDCGWEYFTWSEGPAADCGGTACPDNVLRITAVADLASVPGSPSCGVEADGSLAQIVFQYTTDSTMLDICGIVRFIWFDCGDNAVANASGDTLSISSHVIDYDGWDLAADSALPTVHGAPALCVTDESILRRIDFYNACAMVFHALPDNQRGDINLNDLAYEIADAVLFANALTYGPGEQFDLDFNLQMEATDCNADGILFTLDDYVYLWRVIYGDAFPLAKAAVGDTVWFEQDTLNKVVRMDYADSIRAVYLIFEGDIEPWGWNDSGHPFDGLYTRVLMDVYSMGADIFSYDSLLFYTGEGNLVATYAAYDGILPLPTGIVGSASSCCLNRGNVDGSEDGSINIVDLIRLVQYLFLDGTPPPCAAEADVNANQVVDLADIVRLVDFMFLEGPDLTPCD